MNANKKKIAVVTASLTTLALSSLPATANVVATKNSEGNIVVSGLNHYGSYAIEYTGIPRVKAVSANACGVVTLKTSSSYPITSSSTLKKDGMSYSVSSLPTGATPRCINGTLEAAPTAAAFKDSNNAIYFTGLPAYSKVQITFDQLASVRRVKADACGMFSLRNNSAYQLSNSPISIKMVNGAVVSSEITNFTPSNMTASDTPSCRSGKAYFPEGWTSGSSGSSGS